VREEEWKRNAPLKREDIEEEIGFWNGEAFSKAEICEKEKEAADGSLGGLRKE
jgi:hypothetical protein